MSLDDVQPATRATATLADVARRAGVSQTAVSYVLNENGTRNKHVSEETRAKVLQAIQDLDYSAHTIARALSKGYTHEICLVMDSEIRPFASELMSSIQQEAAARGYPMVIYLSLGISATEKSRLHQTVLGRRPLGLIVSAQSFSVEDYQLAKKKGIPHIVSLTTEAAALEGVYSVNFPTTATGHLAARHLLERGHRRLAIVRPNNPLLEHGYVQRLQAMQAEMREFPDSTLEILPLGFASADARAVVEHHFVSDSHPTGVYGFSDEYALLLLGALERRGLRIPQDVAVVGTDNILIGQFVWPSLTTIRFDGMEVGKRLVEIIDTLERGLPLPEHVTRPLEPQLIQREST